MYLYGVLHISTPYLLNTAKYQGTYEELPTNCEMIFRVFDVRASIGLNGQQRDVGQPLTERIMGDIPARKEGADHVNVHYPIEVSELTSHAAKSYHHWLDAFRNRT
jgi:hypothetical protein